MIRRNFLAGLVSLPFLSRATAEARPTKPIDANEALSDACWSDDVEKAKDALDRGADPEHLCKFEWGYQSMLHICSRRGCTEIAKLLLKKGAHVDFGSWSPASNDMQSPVWVADHPEMIELLLDHDANTDACGSFTLIDAHNQKVDNVKALIQHGVKPKSLDLFIEGNAPSEIIQLLIEKGTPFLRDGHHELRLADAYLRISRNEDGRANMLRTREIILASMSAHSHLPNVRRVKIPGVTPNDGIDLRSLARAAPRGPEATTAIRLSPMGPSPKPSARVRRYSKRST